MVSGGGVRAPDWRRRGRLLTGSSVTAPIDRPSREIRSAFGERASAPSSPPPPANAVCARSWVSCALPSVPTSRIFPCFWLPMYILRHNCMALRPIADSRLSARISTLLYSPSPLGISLQAVSIDSPFSPFTVPHEPILPSSQHPSVYSVAASISRFLTDSYFLIA